uniref:Uncharacterized protein n=1 Tax=Chenopodium quinoa TaxID=63459 RepID=A0A803ND68_CHEQI
MEDETQQTIEVLVVEVKDKLASVTEPIEENGNKEEKESSLDDGEFIKVEREPVEMKDRFRDVEVNVEESKSSNANLKNEALSTEVKLQECGKKYETLEPNHKKLQEEMVETENNFNEKPKSLQDTLEDHETNQKDFSGVKESFESLNLESKISKKKIEELEQELPSRAAELENVVKSSHSIIEVAEKNMGDLESLLEEKKQKIEELEVNISSLE